MNINTYLKYNNIALIDPELDFQANCIEQYERKGFLTPKQLNSLRTWAHSPERIAKLIHIEQPVAIIPDEPKRKRLSTVEVVAILNAIKQNSTLADLHSALPTRSLATIQSTVSRFGGYTRKGQIVGKDQDRFNAICNKYKNTEEDNTTPFD
jgi:hypothetical protein